MTVPYPPLKPETWKAFFVNGCLFTLHIIVGLASVPFLCYQLFSLNVYAWIFAAIYLPFFLYPAQKQYPGWKGFDPFFNWMDYGNTGASYFGVFDVHGTEDIDANQQYFVACHPHGTVIFQRTFWRSDRFHGLFNRPWRMLAASALFYIPIVRELTLFFGAVDASKANCERVLKAGASIVLYPGGLDEANSTEGAADKEVRLRTRTGFIRLAIKYQTPVLPVFTFGELDCVDAVNILPAALTKWVKKTLRMSTTVFMGRFFSFIPYRVPFNMCFGKPIPVNVCETDEEVEVEVARVHAAYKNELKTIYANYKDEFGYEDRALVFTCEKLVETKKKK